MRDPTPADIRAGAEKVRDCFKGAVSGATAARPFFIGRNGTIETETLYFWFTMRRDSDASVDYPPRILTQIQQNAGIFPATAASVDAWCAAYAAALGLLDGLAAGWYKPVAVIEDVLLRAFTKAAAFRTPLRSLEPYYHAPDAQWTSTLKGRRVAVVSSFAMTMEKQAASGRLQKAWTAKDGRKSLDISGVNWSFVRTGYAPATALGFCGWPAGVNGWQDAVTRVVADVLNTGAEVALVGCGGLGMIIGAELRRHGVSVLVLGGSIQVLFGIKGKRWETHDVISKFWNDAWRWPAADEIPGGARFVEGGCYWGAA
jgi:hypothetical protein